MTEPARESPLLAGAVELESESWWLSRPEPLEDAIVREGVMNACRSFVDGEESDIDLDRIEDFFELLDFENTPAAPGLIEFLRFLSRHDGDIGSLAAHRLDVWGVEGARERLTELLSKYCDVYLWNADRFGPLPEPLLEALGRAE